MCAGDCHYYQRNCPPGQFDCRCEDAEELVQTDECIPWSSVCDAFRDCSNGADEVDCLCPAGMFQCSTCEQGGQEDCRSVFQCIDEGLVCDRGPHCITSKDEYGGQCDEDRGYDCEDGSFTSQNARCDGAFSCLNKRDEVDCPSCANNACEETSCSEAKCESFITNDCRDDDEIRQTKHNNQLFL